MKPDYRKLLFWTVLSYLLFNEFKDVTQYGIEYIIKSWSSQKGLLLNGSAFIVFSLYTFTSYTVLIFTQKWKLPGRIALIFLFTLIVISYRYGQEEMLFLKLFGFKNYHNDIGAVDYFWDNLYYAIIFNSVGIVFYFSQYSLHKEAQRKELEIQQKQTELAFLRTQLNPHFLFNTLNNIYTLVYQRSDKALGAMDKLNSLLRYAIYEQAERVPLEVELKHIADFIALQRMRYDFEPNVQLSRAEDIEHLLVPPFLYISFVENGFKHGALRDPERPISFIFEKEQEFLTFRTSNALSNAQKDQQGGVGLDNIKKRLELMYNSRHQLNLEVSDQHFEATLRIPIDLCV
jgi:two-component system LytT family sensor kinase